MGSSLREEKRREQHLLLMQRVILIDCEIHFVSNATVGGGVGGSLLYCETAALRGLLMSSFSCKNNSFICTFTRLFTIIGVLFLPKCLLSRAEATMIWKET